MTEQEKDIISIVWNDLVLRKRLEIDPYGLSPNELKLLKLNDAFNSKLNEISDKNDFETRQTALKAYLG